MRMKKICTVAVITMALALCACGKPDKATQKVIDSINALVESGATEQMISEVDAAYNALDEKQKKKVENYEVLENAKKAITNGKVAVNVARGNYDAIQYAIQNLANTMVIPSSLQVTDIVMCIAGEQKLLYIKADAANMSGEVKTGTYLYDIAKGTVEDTTAYEEYKGYSLQGNQRCCYKIADNFYANKDDISNPTDLAMIFTVDLNDYLYQGYNLH